MPMRTWKKTRQLNPAYPGKGKPNEMEGERARERKTRENTADACNAHFDDLLAAYPRGVPVAADRKVRFVSLYEPIDVPSPSLMRKRHKRRRKDETMAEKRLWNSSQQRWLLPKSAVSAVAADQPEKED